MLKPQLIAAFLMGAGASAGTVLAIDADSAKGDLRYQESARVELSKAQALSCRKCITSLAYEGEVSSACLFEGAKPYAEIVGLKIAKSGADVVGKSIVDVVK